MYVCLCNAIRDAQITQAIESGARDVKSVFKTFHCKPVCSKCLPEIVEMLEDAAGHK